MTTEFFIAIGVFPVQLLAYQVSMICTAIDLFTDTAAILNSEEIMGCPGGR